MTVAHYEFTRVLSIDEHHHPQEELYEVLEGDSRSTVDGVTQVARPRVAAIVPSNARHSVRALTDGRAIIVDSPARQIRLTHVFHAKGVMMRLAGAVLLLFLAP